MKRKIYTVTAKTQQGWRIADLVNRRAMEAGFSDDKARVKAELMRGLPRGALSLHWLEVRAQTLEVKEG